jgi:ribosomal protein S18 acetylase RimI-like enzyme
VTTWLELTAAEQLRPAGPPRAGGVAIDRVDPPDGALNRWFYERVGATHRWTDLLGRDDAAWQRHAGRVETWVATVRGERAGYAELLASDGDVELAYFGLLPAFQGLGLGGHLLTLALGRGLELGARVWVHTATTDGPHALANYEARGLRAYRHEEAASRQSGLVKDLP